MSERKPLRRLTYFYNLKNRFGVIYEQMSVKGGRR
nr:MAG TPA: hypothetical protein [Caudoviricetes sp.]